MRCLWYGVLENLKRIPKVPGSRPFGEKSAVRIDDNGLRIFYKKDTLILLFTIVIIILNMFTLKKAGLDSPAFSLFSKFLKSL